jgi:two-component system response regulator MprA
MDMWPHPGTEEVEMNRVLCVDDDPALLKLVSFILDSDEIHVDTATNGVEALETLDNEKPDLILLDLAMPIMDGPTFYQEARRAGYDGPVVLFSAYGARAACQELGAQAAIDKPFEPEALAEVVTGLLDET